MHTTSGRSAGGRDLSCKGEGKKKSSIFLVKPQGRKNSKVGLMGASEHRRWSQSSRKYVGVDFSVTGLGSIPARRSRSSPASPAWSPLLMPHVPSPGRAVSIQFCGSAPSQALVGQRHPQFAAFPTPFAPSPAGCCSLAPQLALQRGWRVTGSIDGSEHQEGARLEGSMKQRWFLYLFFLIYIYSLFFVIMKSKCTISPSPAISQNQYTILTNQPWMQIQ